MAGWSRPGRRSRAFGRRTTTTSRPLAGATPVATSTASGGPTRTTVRPPIRTRDYSQGPRQGAETLLHEPRAGGEPPRSGGRGRADPGFAERLAAIELVAGRAGPWPITVGADRAYDAADLVMELRQLGATPHVAQNTAGRRSAIDRRTTRHTGYQRSQRARHRIEEVFALGQDHCRATQNRASRSRSGALAVHARGDRLQPDPPAKLVAPAP